MDFVIIVVALIVLVGFLGTIIIKLSQQVGKQIDKDVNELINTYDSLLDTKSKRIEELAEEIKSLQEQRDELIATMPEDDYDYESGGVTMVVQGGHFIDDTFYDKYNLIRNEFHDLALEATIEVIGVLSKKRRDINVHEYKELLSIFDYNLQYKMDTLEPSDQLEVMKQIINNSIGKKRVVERYLKEYGVFSFEGFIDYLRSYIFFHDNVIHVYCRDGISILEDTPRNVEFNKDTTIGEGFVIRYRDQYYDFSLKGGLYE